ncbi:hypothetical protein ABE10_02680 [Bacillus toyonensis]|nr:hypothetical protein [Bacillus toyonensis]
MRKTTRDWIIAVGSLVLVGPFAFTLPIAVAAPNVLVAALPAGDRPSSVTEVDHDLAQSYADEIAPGLLIRWDAEAACAGDDLTLACVLPALNPSVIHLAPRLADDLEYVARAVILHEATHSIVALDGIDIPEGYGGIEPGVPAGEAFADCVAVHFEPESVGIVGYLPEGCPDDLQDRALELIGK